ncbi:MAG: M23 family metallopeptidase [Polyangiales bacterium]
MFFPGRSAARALVAVACMAWAQPLAHADGKERGPREPGEESCNQAIPAEVFAALGSPTWTAMAPGAATAVARPTSWQSRSGRDCHRYRGRRVCEGPRRIARGPRHAEAVRLALGIGTQEAGHRMLREGAKQDWLDAVSADAPRDFLFPVDTGRVWRGFGKVRKGRARRRPHEGIDIGASVGTPIRAAADGLVVYSDNQISGYGNFMIVLHKDGLATYYAHCNANYVVAGEHVVRGQVIGEVGETGLARGAHLHFELRRRGRAINPAPRLHALKSDVADASEDDANDDAL